MWWQFNAKHPPQNFWSFIKGLRKENPSIKSLNYNGNVLVDPIAKADALNSQIFTAEDHSCLPNKGQSPHSSYNSWPEYINIWSTQFVQ